MASPPRRVLVVGSGGREHALVWKLSQGMRADETIFTTHPSLANLVAPCTMAPAPAGATVDELVAFAVAQGVTLVVVGPEGPLAEGIAGELSRRRSAPARRVCVWRAARREHARAWPHAARRALPCGLPVILRAHQRAAG